MQQTVHPHMRGVNQAGHRDGKKSTVHPHMRGVNKVSQDGAEKKVRFIPTCVGLMNSAV